MADIIKLLPDAVANQIAAGEVVQRPASVVKELLENSVDSGATRIKLIIKDAGKALIQVIDNGCGMSPTDARLSFERHATSKISSANDLFSIKSKGFRGEALASIASVAHVELKTKRADDELATHIIIEGSKILSQEPTTASNGTNFIVKNLFFNIPARRNFLKSNNVEWRHVLDEFNRLSLTHPEVAFELQHNGSIIHNISESSLKQRIINIFGKNYNQRLVPLEEDTSITRITGYICKPEFAKKTRGEQFLFVNNRFIKSNYFHYAISNAYNELIDTKHHPSYFLYLEIDPAKIDVNIHPTKTEIKFEEEKAIYAIINSAVKQSIGKHNISPTIDFEPETSFNVLPPKENQEIRIPKTSVNTAFNPFQKGSKIGQSEALEDFYSNIQFEKEAEQESLTFESDLNSDEEKSTTIGPESIFQIHNRYIVSQIKSGVIIVDQRLAHKRVIYEKLKQRFKNQSVVSQQLVFPENIELSSNDFNTIKEMWDNLKMIGFDIEEFGQNSVVINGVPIELKEVSIESTLQELIESYRNTDKSVELSVTDNIAKVLSDYSAINQGKSMTKEEMEHLINQLFSCEIPFYAPNGKPTLKTFTLDNLNKMFD